MAEQNRAREGGDGGRKGEGRIFGPGGPWGGFGFYLKEVGAVEALSMAGMWSGSGAHGCPLMAVREQAVGHEARSHWGPAWRDGASPGGRRWRLWMLAEPARMC